MIIFKWEYNEKNNSYLGIDYEKGIGFTVVDGFNECVR